jgi:hypothetical protein
MGRLRLSWLLIPSAAKDLLHSQAGSEYLRMTKVELERVLQSMGRPHALMRIDCSIFSFGAGKSMPAALAPAFCLPSCSSSIDHVSR